MSIFCTPTYKSKCPQQLVLIPCNITYQGTKGVLFLQFYLLSQKILKAFINYLQSYLLDQKVSIAFGQIIYTPTYWIKKPVIKNYWIKISKQFLSISCNLAYQIKNLWTVFINFLQPYLSERKNLNSFYQFLTTLLIKLKNLQQFLSISYTPT